MSVHEEATSSGRYVFKESLSTLWGAVKSKQEWQAASHVVSEPSLLSHVRTCHMRSCSILVCSSDLLHPLDFERRSIRASDHLLDLRIVEYFLRLRVPLDPAIETGCKGRQVAGRQSSVVTVHI